MKCLHHYYAKIFEYINSLRCLLNMPSQMGKRFTQYFRNNKKHRYFRRWAHFRYRLPHARLAMTQAVTSHNAGRHRYFIGFHCHYIDCRRLLSGSSISKYSLRSHWAKRGARELNERRCLILFRRYGRHHDSSTWFLIAHSWRFFNQASLLCYTLAQVGQTFSRFNANAASIGTIRFAWVTAII